MDSQWLVPAVVVLLVAILAWATRAARKRQKALKRVAQLLGTRFEKRIETLGQDGLNRLPMFSKGTIRAQNVIYGDIRDAVCYLFDYVHVKRQRGGRRSTHGQGTYSCVRLHDARLPIFRIAPASRDGRNESIVFDSHPDFCSRYVVTGEDERAVRRLLSNSLLDHLQQKSAEAWTIEADSEWLGMVKRPASSLKRHIDPADIRQFRDDMLQIYQRLLPD